MATFIYYIFPEFVKEIPYRITQEDVDKIINAILKFADLMNCREKDYIFDLNKFSDVTGKTGPYILYTINFLFVYNKNEWKIQ